MSIWGLAAVVTVLKPMYEMTSSAPLFTASVKLPSRSVTVAFVVPFSVTVAPITVSPSGCFTTPFTVSCWAKATVHTIESAAPRMTFLKFLILILFF